MRYFFLCLLLVSLDLLADDKAITDEIPYSIRLGAGFADYNDLNAILQFDYNRYDKNLYVINLDGGWRAGKNIFDTPIDVYLKGGLSYFDERGWADNIFEATLYIKFIWKIDFYGNRIRLGFGEGISFAQDIPYVEQVDASESEEKATARLLNYLDISADIDIGRLIRVDSMRDLYLGYTIKHRSGVKGLYSGVHRGSNYVMLTLEKNF